MIISNSCVVELDEVWIPHNYDWTDANLRADGAMAAESGKKRKPGWAGCGYGGRQWLEGYDTMTVIIKRRKEQEEPKT